MPRFFIPSAPVAASTTPHAPNVQESDMLSAAEPSLDNNICSDHDVDPETEGVQAGIANGLLGSSAIPEALPSPRGDNILDAGESDGWPLRTEHDPLLPGLGLPLLSCGSQGGTCMSKDVHSASKRRGLGQVQKGYVVNTHGSGRQGTHWHAFTPASPLRSIH